MNKAAQRQPTIEARRNRLGRGDAYVRMAIYTAIKARPKRADNAASLERHPPHGAANKPAAFRNAAFRRRSQSEVFMANA
jgi:hypothetical protein